MNEPGGEIPIDTNAENSSDTIHDQAASLQSLLKTKERGITVIAGEKSDHTVMIDEAISRATQNLLDSILTEEKPKTAETKPTVVITSEKITEHPEEGLHLLEQLGPQDKVFFQPVVPDRIHRGVKPRYVKGGEPKEVLVKMLLEKAQVYREFQHQVLPASPEQAESLKQKRIRKLQQIDEKYGLQL